jgi:hypothetical protein
VLIGSFACFLILAGWLAYGVVWYVRSAVEVRGALLQVVAGESVFVKDRSESAWRQALGEVRLREGDAVRTRGGGKAFIALFDGSNIILYPGTEVHLSEVRNARFVSRVRTIKISVSVGTIRLAVAPSAEYPRVHFQVDTPTATMVVRRPDGASIRVDVMGTDGLTSSFMVRRGEAAVTARGNTVKVPEGTRVTVPDGAPPSEPMAGGIELVRNGNFVGGYEGWQINRPEAADGTDRNGEVYFVPGDGFGSWVRMVRLGGNNTHADLGIAQDLEQDVSDFEKLQLRLRLRVDYHSLSGGGVLASEYPLIVKLVYMDAFGRSQEFYRGFYYHNEEGNPVDNGELVPRGEWVDVTVDLFSIVPRPAYLISLSLFASGHDFDSRVSGVSIEGR